MKTFQNYDSRDILRLSKDDLVQVSYCILISNFDGIINSLKRTKKIHEVVYIKKKEGYLFSRTLVCLGGHSSPLKYDNLEVKDDLLNFSVSDPDPVGSVSFGRIRIRIRKR